MPFMHSMRSIPLCLLLTLCILAPGEAHAFRFSPFRAEFKPAGPAANQLFLVDNNTNEPASVQISVTTREVDENGVETNKAAEKDFVIYPAQMVLEPHTKRSVRVQWAGNANLKTEKAYRIVAEQLPVNLDRDKAGRNAVKFLVNYRGALFVTPPRLKQDVVLESFKSVQSGGKKMLELVFNNRGGKHALLQDLALDFGNGATLSDEKQLKGLTGEGILAMHKRRFLLPWPKQLAATPAAVNFTYNKQAF